MMKRKILAVAGLCACLTTGCAGNLSKEPAAAKSPIASLFPAADPQKYSKGMESVSSQWKAKAEIPVFRATGDPETELQEMTSSLKKGDEFRVTALRTFPAGYSSPEQVFGLVADGSGWAVLYDTGQKTAVQADLLQDPRSEIMIPIQTFGDMQVYDKIDGSPKKNSSVPTAITQLELGTDGWPWGLTAQGWIPLWNESGVSFFTPIDDLVFGEFQADDSVADVYNRIRAARIFENSSGALNWGYALEDLDGDSHPELLVMDGGLNKDVTATVYGATDKVLTGVSDGSFSAACSKLYRDASSGILRFSTDGNECTVTRISQQQGIVMETSLTDKEIDALEPDLLKPVELFSVYDSGGLSHLQDQTAGTWYPDHPFNTAESQGNSADSQPEVQRQNASESWKLNYDMRIRLEPDRTSGEKGLLSSGQTIIITEKRASGSETWGRLENGGWICLKDADHDYAFPSDGRAQNSLEPADWKSVYREVVKDEASNPRYSSYLEFDPSWYLWTNAGYDIPVLVLRTGVCEADYQLEFYLAKDDRAVLLDTVHAGHSTFYSTDQPGQFDALMAHMGVESIDRYSLENGTMVSQNLSLRQDVLDYQEPTGVRWVFQNAAAFQ